MCTLWQDVRYGIRMMAKNPGFTGVAVITLALGIGMNTAIFSVVNTILFRPLPVERPGELVAVFNKAPRPFGPVTHEPMAYPDFRDLRDASTSFTGMICYNLIPLALERGDESEVVIGNIVTGDFFQTLGVRAALGRTILPEEDRTPGTHPVAVLSHAAWQRRFGGDVGVVGRPIRLNGAVFTVVGVAPAGFTGLLPALEPEMWVPMQTNAVLRPDDPGRLENRSSRGLFVLARLQPGISLSHAQAELQTINERLKRDYPESNKDRDVEVMPAAGVKFMPGLDRVLYATSFVLLAIVSLVLLIASANVANLLLARATARKREMAIRLSMGATRGRLVRLLLTESLLLSLAGGAAGTLVAGWSNAALNALPVSLPIPIKMTLGLAFDWRVFAFALALSTLTAVVFGLAPALAASRTDLVSSLKEETGAAAGSRAKRRLQSALVVAQVALSLVLLIGGGLSLRSLWNANRVNPGFEVKGVVMASLTPTLAGYKLAQAEEFYRLLTERLRAIPGVESVAVASHLPLTFEIRTTEAAPEGDPRPEKEWPDIDNGNAGPAYFATLRIPIVLGRPFTEHDTTSAPRVAIVNEALAQQFWPRENPLGRRMRLRGREGVYEVVGVARNSKYRTLGESPRPYIYLAQAQNFFPDQVVLVRAAGELPAVLAALRREIRQLDVKVPVMALRTLEEANSVTLLFPRAGAALFALFGTLGLLLAAVGLYGVIAYGVSQRTHEIGIRLALGASEGNILGLVIGQGLKLTLAGVLIGLAGAMAATRVISVLLYGISATDPVTFVLVSGVLSGVALVACYLPARRATRIDPAVALRYE